MIKNKRAMIQRLISGFIVILVGISILPVIADQISKSQLQNCTEITQPESEQPTGPTDSFGGGGTHFGGYDGVVVHKDFYGMGKKTTYDCSNTNITGVSKTVLNLATLVPAFFTIGLLVAGVSVIFQALNDVGLLGSSSNEEQTTRKRRKRK